LFHGEAARATEGLEREESGYRPRWWWWFAEGNGGLYVCVPLRAKRVAGRWMRISSTRQRWSIDHAHTFEHYLCRLYLFEYFQRSGRGLIRGNLDHRVSPQSCDGVRRHGSGRGKEHACPCLLLWCGREVIRYTLLFRWNRGEM